jgi:hypothetical protein
MTRNIWIALAVVAGLSTATSNAALVVDLNGTNTTLGPTLSGAEGWSAFTSNTNNQGNPVTAANTYTTNFPGTGLGQSGSVNATMEGYQGGAFNFATGVLNGGNGQNLPGTGTAPGLRNDIRGRDRGVAGTPNISAQANADMLRDLIFAPHLRLTLSGLTPGAQYNAKFFTYESSASGAAIQRVYDITAVSGGVIGPSTVAPGIPASPEAMAGRATVGQGTLLAPVGAPSVTDILTGGSLPVAYSDGAYSAAGTVTADSAGMLTFRVSSLNLTATGFNDNAKLSGFSLVPVVIPEPATVSVLAVTGLTILLRRR